MKSKIDKIFEGVIFPTDEEIAKETAGRISVDKRMSIEGGMDQIKNLAKTRDKQKWDDANSQANKKQWANPERREIHDNQLKEMNSSAEVYKNKLEGIKRRELDPENHKKRADGAKRSGEAKRGKIIGKCTGVWRGTSVSNPSIIVEFTGTAALENGDSLVKQGAKLRASAVADCVAGRKNSHGGYTWEYVEK